MLIWPKMIHQKYQKFLFWLETSNRILLDKLQIQFDLDFVMNNLMKDL